MSMKKKFLALALAGAVAMPVIANATTLGPNVTGTDKQAQYGQVTVNGQVENGKGQAPAGQISVELPMAMGFTVNQAGDLLTANGSSYNVQNKGTSAVKIDVVEFRETKSTTGITVKAESEFAGSKRASLTRDNVSLILSGDGNNRIDLGAILNKTTEATLFDEIPSMGNETMTLTGVAGTSTAGSVETTGAQEDFIVKFKVTKKGN